MGSVVGLSGYLQARRHGLPGRAAAGGASGAFTLRDRQTLEAWSHGERRAVINRTETGTFAMLYEGRCWASRGVVRQSTGILLWDCVTHADIGRFPTMEEALNGMADVGPLGLPGNILPIRGRTAAASDGRRVSLSR